MAMTTSIYNHTAQLLLASTVVLETATLKLALLNDTAAFDATHTQFTQVTSAGAYEVSGNGWTAGGMTLANVSVSTTATNAAMLDADDIGVTATGGPITAHAAVLYVDDGADDAPLLYVDFDGEKSALDGQDFQVIWRTTGIMSLAVA